ncbi:MAG: NAD+ synthase [Methanobrevibacter sp.]|uniref:NAD+ synthase n=1 Tax=Methanobrevibacter sp. TaxID=66852 RepID=UPI0026E02A04|nr:NAD+ synthase [Methanobrevibacter sp.]MDO5847981.1 NAD+ synthase [Methanobrevibacter sp.]
MTQIPDLNVKTTKEELMNFIKEKVAEANAEGIVVGLSGGIDSTVTAFLATEALGKENVFGLVMPSTTTPTEDKIHGTDIAKRLGIEYKEMAIDKVLNEFLLVSNTPEEENELAIGNLKARIRMALVYYFANIKNYIVGGTGNKSEILIGYFTKYGDGASDMEPIGELYKTEVRQLAKYIGIPEEIIEKPPRAGLWNNQTDEEEIGMPYEILDRILYGYIDLHMDAKEIADDIGIPLEEVERIILKVKNNTHKSKIPATPNNR